MQNCLDGQGRVVASAHPARALKQAKEEDHDFAVNAFRVVQEATVDADQDLPAEETPLAATRKNSNAVALGRLGRKRGGKARAEKLTPEQRSDIARSAAQAHWQPQ